MIVVHPNYTVRDILEAAGIPAEAIRLGDGEYGLLSESDIQRFAISWSAILSGMEYDYEAEVQDCDDFAQGACFWARHFCALQRAPKWPVAGVALGFCWSTELAHAFNFAIHRSDADVDYVQFYEPQRDGRGFCMTPMPQPREIIKTIYNAIA